MSNYLIDFLRDSEQSLPLDVLMRVRRGPSRGRPR